MNQIVEFIYRKTATVGYDVLIRTTEQETIPILNVRHEEQARQMVKDLRNETVILSPYLLKRLSIDF